MRCREEIATLTETIPITRQMRSTPATHPGVRAASATACLLAVLQAALAVPARAQSAGCRPRGAHAGATIDSSARCDSATLRDRRALRRNSLTLGGLPGLVNVPVAAATPSGMADFALNDERTPSLVPNLGIQRNMYIMLGFLPRVTIGARAMVAEDTLKKIDIRDLGAQVQVQVLDEGRWTPSVAVGVQDVGGVNAYFHAQYVVASRNVFDHARVSMGYGAGPVRLKGAFGGLEADVGPWATAMGEFDGERYAGGLRLFPFPAMADRAGLQPKVDVTWRQDLGFAIGGGIRVSLSGPPSARDVAETPTTRAAAARDTMQVPASGRSPRAARGAAPRETGVDAVRRALVAQGFENVRVALLPVGGAMTIVVEYENRRFNRDELDALGIVMGITSAYAPAAVTAMRVTILRVDLPVITITSGIGAFADFANERMSESAFADQLGFPSPSRTTRPPGDSRAANSSRWKVDLFVRPRVETVVLSDFGVFDARVAALPDAYVQLGRGLVLNARRAIPVSQTTNFPSNLNDPNGDRLLLHQALPLRFGGSRSDWRALTEFSVGRFGHEEVGVADEVAVSLPSGLVSFGGTLGVLGRTFSDLNRAIALGTVRVRYPSLDLTASLAAGRFRNGDAGAAGELSRLFGDTELTFYLRSTEFQSVTGVRVALPLTPARELRPARVRPRLPDLYSQELHSTVFAPLPVLRRDVARLLDTDHDIGRIYWDRDRLQPVTIRAHVLGVREAVRRWAEWCMLVDRANPEK